MGESILPSQKYTVKPPLERLRVKQELQALSDVSWEEKPEQYCEYRLDGSAGGGWLRVKQYTNGTLLLDASSDELLARMTGLMNGNGAAVAATPAAAKKDKPGGQLNLTGAYIGTDESGKGDYFGPLVIAGTVVNDHTVPILKELGVMDSKKLNDGQISQLATQIVQVVGEPAVSVVEIGPKRYNELYDKFKASGKNLNHLLAWGHATVIENLLATCPDCAQAVADQFGNERYITSQLKDKGKGITLHQVHRAEANVGVAAASIIARHRFVQKVRRLSAQFGVDLFFGAGPKVVAQAKVFVQRYGKDRLNEIAKLHFKTTGSL